MSVRSQRTAACDNYVDSGKFRFLTEIEYPCNASMRQALERAHQQKRTGVLARPVVTKINGDTREITSDGLMKHRAVGYGATVSAIEYPPRAWPIGKSTALSKMDDPPPAPPSEPTEPTPHLSLALAEPADRPHTLPPLLDAVPSHFGSESASVMQSFETDRFAKSLQTRAVFASKSSPETLALSVASDGAQRAFGAIGCRSMKSIPSSKPNRDAAPAPVDSITTSFEAPSQQSHVSSTFINPLSTRPAFDEADTFWRDMRKKLNGVAAKALLSIACVEEAKVFQGPDLTLPSRCSYNHLHGLEHMREVATDDKEAAAIVAQTGEAELVEDNAPRELRWQAALNRPIARNIDPADVAGTVSGIIVSAAASGALPAIPARRRSRRHSSITGSPILLRIGDSSLPFGQSIEKSLGRCDSDPALLSSPLSSPPEDELRADAQPNITFEIESTRRRSRMVPKPPTEISRPLIPQGRRVSMDLRESGLVSESTFATAEARAVADGSTRFHRGAAVVDIANDSSLTAAQRKVAMIRRQAASEASSMGERVANDMLRKRDGQLFIADDVEGIVMEQLQQEAERYANSTNNQRIVVHKALHDMDASARQFEKGLAARRLMRNRKQVDHEDRPEIDWQMWKIAATRALETGREGVSNTGIAARMQVQWISAGKTFDGSTEVGGRGDLPCYTARTLANTLQSSLMGLGLVGGGNTSDPATPLTAR